MNMQLNRNKGTFGSRLKKAISTSIYSEKEIASYIGVSSNQMSRYVNNKSIPSADQLAGIADRLGVSMDTLWGREEYVPQPYSQPNTSPTANNLEAQVRENSEKIKNILDLFSDLREKIKDLGPKIDKQLGND